MMSRLDLMKAINRTEEAMMSVHDGAEIQQQTLLAGIEIMANAMRTEFFGEFSRLECITEDDGLTVGNEYWVIYVEPDGYTIIGDRGIPITRERSNFKVVPRA